MSAVGKQHRRFTTSPFVFKYNRAPGVIRIKFYGVDQDFVLAGIQELNGDGREAFRTRNLEAAKAAKLPESKLFSGSVRPGVIDPGTEVFHDEIVTPRTLIEGLERNGYGLMSVGTYFVKYIDKKQELELWAVEFVLERGKLSAENADALRSMYASYAKESWKLGLWDNPSLEPTFNFRDEQSARTSRKIVAGSQGIYIPN